MYVILHAFFFVEWILRKILWKKGRLLKKVLKKSLIPIPRRQQVRIFNSVNYFPFVIFRSCLVFHLHRGYHAQKHYKRSQITYYNGLTWIDNVLPTYYFIERAISQNCDRPSKRMFFSSKQTGNREIDGHAKNLFNLFCWKARTVFLPLLFFSLFSFFFLMEQERPKLLVGSIDPLLKIGISNFYKRKIVIDSDDSFIYSIKQKKASKRGVWEVSGRVERNHIGGVNTQRWLANREDR